jgi:hypothetical protein
MEDQDRRSPSLAGTATDAREKGPAHEIENSQNPSVKAPTPEGSGVRYRVLVRALPTVGKAALDHEELTKSYRREIEHVLSNDQIPSNYREYIKNYFLSIGMER